MAKNIEAPSHIKIAAFHKEKEKIGDPMAAGSGTPWEDRGALGSVNAFIKSVKMAMFSPRTLLYSIRRPEITTDARRYIMICGTFWALAWLISDLTQMFRHKVEFSFPDHFPMLLIHAAIGFLGTWLLMSIGSKLFYKLASAGDMKAKFPPVLVYNVFAYCLSPSVLAIIPFYIGPSLAAIWIVGLMMYAAATRLAIKTSGAIICTMISVVGIAGLGVVLYLLANWLLGGVQKLISG